MVGEDLMPSLVAGHSPIGTRAGTAVVLPEGAASEGRGEEMLLCVIVVCGTALLVFKRCGWI